MKIARSLVAAFAAVLAFSAVAVSTPALAAPSDLDPTYGNAGMAVLPITVTYGAGFSALDDSTSAVSGKVLVGGLYRFSTARFSPSGTLDTSFRPPTGVDAPDRGAGESTEINAIALSSQGVFSTGLDTASGIKRSIAYMYDPAGGDAWDNDLFQGTECVGNATQAASGQAHLVAGSCKVGGEDYPVLARYSSFSTLDSSFATNGWAPASTTKGSFGAVTTQPDGKIVATGGSASGDYLLTRFTADGDLDNSFTDGVTGSPGLRGRVIAPIGVNGDNANSVAVQPNGKIVAAGSSSDVSFHLHPSIARFEAGGSLDTSFGDGGKKILTLATGTSYIQGISLQADGKIVAVGVAGDANYRVFVARFTPEGQLDPSFATGGILMGLPGSTAEFDALGVKVLPDGKILFGTQMTVAGTKVVGVVRLLGDKVSNGAGGGSVAKPTSRIKSPSKSKLAAKKFKRVTGTATGATKVQLAIVKTDKRLLKKKRCLQMKNSKAALKKVKSVKGKCVPSVWLAAKGTTSWTYTLKKHLKSGKYKIYVRAIGAGGTSDFAKKSLKLTR